MDNCRYTEGVCGSGAMILFDGKPVPIGEVVSRLNSIAELEAKLAVLSKEAQSTVNELRGSLGAYEPDLRAIMGNTNFHCLELRRDKLASILSGTPKVLAVVEGHYDDGMWWEDCDGNKSLTISADPYDGSTTIITFVLAKEAE